MIVHLNLLAHDRAITLEELRDFISRCEQMEMPGDTRFKVHIFKWSGLLSSITSAPNLPPANK